MFNTSLTDQVYVQLQEFGEVRFAHIRIGSQLISFDQIPLSSRGEDQIGSV